ncbi:hypothetical protein SAMN05421541_103247 [Actinoplanes philippinensis]|uniref:PknH-like extracellular domain-containing protein n=2 Tax=Actinoplanes philippinensis TaxID=35752 RepID=A0A1I2CXZ2_9ACTN|nr:hypothetical protein SAMN05421541_103247 [Actinoplanes philippinensis]
MTAAALATAVTPSAAHAGPPGEPDSGTFAPITAPVAPAGVNAAPAGVNAAPAGVNAAPARVSTASAGVQAAPAGVNAAPARVSTASAGVQAAPAGVRTAPAAAGVSSATAASVPPPDDPVAERLTAALLAAGEAPAGFTPQTDAVDDLFARIPAEIAACGTGARVPAGTVYREYVRGAGEEELLVETLAEPGADAARAAVTKLAGVLPACTSFTRAAGEVPADMGFALSAYPLAPAIGDASAAVSFVMTVPTLKLTVKGRLLAAAAGKTYVTVMLMSEADPKVADLEAAARAAVAKVA